MAGDSCAERCDGSKVIALYDSKVTQIERSEKVPYAEIVGGDVR